MIDGAIERLEAFGDVHRLLARPVTRTADVAIEVESVCRAVCTARPAANRSTVTFDLASVVTDGTTARRIALVASELVTNAQRHALDDRRGSLTITVEEEGGLVVLTVADDGPGLRAAAATSGTGYGRGIVTELVERANGAISVETGPRGTTVSVAVPISAGGADADDYVF
jgi:two-component sensor histidine kinase